MAMANTIHVDVVSAEESIYSGDAEFVVLPGVMGELGVYPKHTPLITQIKPGEVRIKVPGQAEEQIVFVQGGYLEIQPDVVTVLSDTAIRAKDLDEAKALRAKQAAEEAMQNKASKEDVARAEGELAGAMAQLAAIRKLRKGRG
jgi:F-type H+-transporting ATPase subunit epsilon